MLFVQEETESADSKESEETNVHINPLDVKKAINNLKLDLIYLRNLYDSIDENGLISTNDERPSGGNFKIQNEKLANLLLENRQNREFQKRSSYKNMNKLAFSGLVGKLNSSG